jgi:hypothetical protein
LKTEPALAAMADHGEGYPEIAERLARMKAALEAPD